MTITPFARLLGLQRTVYGRERLNTLKQEYALTDRDPIWELVAVVEEFCMELKAESACSGSSSGTPEQKPPPGPTRVLDGKRSFVLCYAAAAAQTFLLGMSAYIGAHVTVDGAWLGAMLSVPVGWVIFPLLAPLLAAVTYRGWRARRAEPGIGWTLALAGVAASVAMFVALWRLL